MMARRKELDGDVELDLDVDLDWEVGIRFEIACLRGRFDNGIVNEMCVSDII